MGMLRVNRGNGARCAKSHLRAWRYILESCLNELVVKVFFSCWVAYVEENGGALSAEHVLIDNELGQSTSES